MEICLDGEDFLNSSPKPLTLLRRRIERSLCAPTRDEFELAGIFAGVGTLGSFNTNAFTHCSATTAAHRIIYNSGQLLYDADGNGAGAAVLFATLQGDPALDANDFTVI